MKKYLKIIALIVEILIIVVATTIFFVKGFEKSIEYKAGTRIEVYIPKGYEKQDVINMAKETFDTEKILFLEIEQLNQVAGIKLIEEYSEEQLEGYLDKISEKYGISEKDMIYHEISVPETNLSNIVKPYILPILFTTTLSLIYIILRNYKTNAGVKIPLRFLKILVITLGIYFSIILMFRLQFSIYTMPLALTIYIVDLLIATSTKCE